MRNIDASDDGVRRNPGGAPRAAYGIALDVGTTNISMSVFKWKNGERLAAGVFANPQGAYGTDVIARLLKAATEAVALDLQYRLFAKIKEFLRETALNTGIDLTDVSGIGMVGNTAMLALMHNCAHQQLLDPQYWQGTFTFGHADNGAVADFLGVRRDVNIEIFHPLAGFVGSDLLAGVTAVRVLERESGTLFVDFGTNTEIALWDGNTLWVTAASGGPAFEGCGMSCGSAAGPGAISRVGGAERPGHLFDVSVIGGGNPRGICGSGYVDIISMLLDLRLLDNVGRFTEKIRPEQEVMIREKPCIKVTKRDIDTLQRAKAAVAAGMRSLLLRAGMAAADIGRIYVAGNFGRYLDIPHAQRIGLLPNINPDRVWLCGNAALRGCEEVMLCRRAGEMLTRARSKAKYVNLAFEAEFEALFMESLYFKPF